MFRRERGLRMPLQRSLPVLLGAIALGLASCSAPREDADPPANSALRSVIAADTILCDLTRQIAAETVELTCLMEPDQDPHTYQPTPSDRRALEQADLVLYGGYDLAPNAEGVIAALSEERVKAIAVYEAAVPDPVLAAHSHSHAEGEDEEHAHAEDAEHTHAEGEEHTHAEEEGDLVPDPHVWHDVKNVVAAVDVIAEALSDLNPEQAERYAENAADLQAELERLDAWVAEQLATVPEGRRVLVTTHDAFNYYVQAYDFADAIALQGLSTDDAPSAARVKAMTETIAAAKVPTIFVEATANPKGLETVAREAKVKVAEQPLFTGALGPEGSETATYVQAIAYNTCVIAEGLGGTCQPFTAGN